MTAAPALSTQCRLCAHPKRAELEAMLADGTSQVAVAALAGVDQSAISRHCRNHGLSTAAMERAARRLLPALVLGADPRIRPRSCERRSGARMTAAEAAKELKSLPRFGRELFRCLELELRYGGEPPADGDEVAAEQRGGMKALAAVILAALSDLPEARERVAHALAGMALTEGARA